MPPAPPSLSLHPPTILSTYPLSACSPAGSELRRAPVGAVPAQFPDPANRKGAFSNVMVRAPRRPRAVIASRSFRDHLVCLLKLFQLAVMSPPLLQVAVGHGTRGLPPPSPLCFALDARHLAIRRKNKIRPIGIPQDSPVGVLQAGDSFRYFC